MDSHLILRYEVESDVRCVQIVVRKKLLDDILLVPTADDEVIVTESRVILHNVPKDRPLAHLNHGFGNEMALFADTGTKAAG